MKRNVQFVKGILTAMRKREAGSMTTPEGREISWEAGDLIYLLPEGTERGSINKYTIHPKCVKDISAKTEEVGWGALCQLTIDNNMVTDLDVISDAYSDISL